MSASRPSVSKHLRPNTRSIGKQRMDLTKKKLRQLKLIFPKEITNLDSVKLIHPGIKQVNKIISGIHMSPKFKLNTQCFVEFENKTSADRAFKILQDKKVEGGHLIVRRMKPLKEPKKRSSSGSTTPARKSLHSHELIVKQLPGNVKNEDIKAAFPDCSRIKLAVRRRQASFYVPSVKSLESYLACPIHTVNGEVVELHSATHPARMSKSHPRKSPRKRAPRIEQMESESFDPDKMEVNSDEIQQSSIDVEEIF